MATPRTLAEQVFLTCDTPFLPIFPSLAQEFLVLQCEAGKD